MSKTEYHFNTETLSFEKVKITFKKRFWNLINRFISSISLAFIMIFLIYTFIDSPKEQALKREKEEILSQYQLLNKEVERLDHLLENLEQRDNNIYRIIFESDPIPLSIRRANTGGSNRYEHMEHLNNSDIVIETSKQIDELAKAIYIQSKSYDQIEELARNKINMLASIPAILPISLTPETRISSSFGHRIHPIYKTLKFHAGMDFSGKIGTSIYATGDGIIEKNATNKGFGRYIIINHGFNHKTLYAHLNKSLVKQGQKVRRGEIIGHLGNSGLSSAPHLHYEVHKNNQPVNPINYYFKNLSAEEFDVLVEAANNTGQSMD